MSEFHSGIERANFLVSEPTFARPPEAVEATPADRPSRYYQPDPTHPERLLRVDADDRAPAQADLTATAMHGAFRAFILDPHYPCVGARSAVNNHAYRLGIYDPLGGPEATAALARDLAAFTRGLDDMDASFATFVAIFDGPQDCDEQAFERALWTQLQALHEADAAPWDSSVSSDPDDPHFSFSYAGTAFFIVGLHPGSNRLSRKFPWPALVFNPHAQFERLRETGKYARMQTVVRNKERALQGDINPVLGDFGGNSEARQYSGRLVEPDWRPPFQVRGEDDAAVQDEPAAPAGCPFHHHSRSANRSDTPEGPRMLPTPTAQPRPGVRYRIPAHSGVAFTITRGQLLRIVDPQGRQVCDLYSLAREELREHLSSGRSIDYADKLYLSTGDVLYSNRERAMWTIGRDDVGRHDLVLTPCSPEMYRRLRGDDGTHPSCYENLRGPLSHFGVESDSIGSTFNIFMDVRFDPTSGKMTIAAPPSRAGDCIELRAEMDMVVGLTACSSEVTNDGSLKPIDFELVVE
ncbi:guanitoxin biosynthesis heme-dependent pre-guanitoxin N-hydroxylase GntA [Nannocystis bainbridge]|uniref:Guanitoxin biosynthesis heme-dependent pre-guanitoxin N-hydroxylase GntA n=1 Tax=Nannocystis bainbridge TaxID=2995303 RepID=A0ABT5EAC5_9BACT|nr:guanitoxin biosynthesis heme-dependent pre-guanitoxin N-hydroxylase GntA [Nannocystis bainbridge]MDC0722804.1 guanitoxin biosynthesis heme-dependent pre-guanitoxin N-hydroxylase GntA [Nannocystis bainbridge]